MHWTIPKKYLYILTLVLVVPALLINLGLMTFIDDEGIRALVALEMELSGNYIVPTINGDYYYNKPPLYNWFLLVSFKLFGEFSEWTARFPTVVFLCAYAALIYRFYQTRYGVQVAFINAFALISCGRILFWDSMLGLIDICFSGLMFANFLWIFHYFEKGKHQKMFIGSWLFTALGFLLKGLPALVFQGFTILAWLLYNRQFKKLFLPSHFVAAGLFLLIVGGYYLAYHQYNDLTEVFPTLFSESAKRTVIEYGWQETVLQIFSFPFEMIYHFLPWTLLVLYFFNKNIFKILRQDRFIVFCSLVFMANIPIYWTSPEVYPRYLLMLFPLLFTVLIHLHFEYQKSNPIYTKILRYLLLGLSSIIFLGAFVPFFLKILHDIPFWTLKSLSLIVALGLVLFSFYNDKKNSLLHLILVLLLLRIGFNWFVLPQRNEEDLGDKVRQASIQLGKAYKDKPIYIYKYAGLRRTNAFYITRERGAIIERKHDDFQSDIPYLVNKATYLDVEGTVVDSLPCRNQNTIHRVMFLKEK